MQAAATQFTSVPNYQTHQGLEGLPAVVTIGAHPTNTRHIEALVWTVNMEGILLSLDESLQDATYAWIELDLPNLGVIRPLMRIEEQDGDNVWLTYRHLFPKDRELLRRSL